MDELFKKDVPVGIKSSERNERQVAIGVTILLNVTTSPVHKKWRETKLLWDTNLHLWLGLYHLRQGAHLVRLRSKDPYELAFSPGEAELLIRLTDESDPFFLYTLALGEDDFQGLKTQQGLLVDFTAFPQKFIDLLELCLSESGKENPKFLLHFALSPMDKGVSVLDVVETNPFRHLTHLSLKFVPASDIFLKKYLAECLIKLKDENGHLSERLTATKTDLSAQLAHCQEALSNRSRELEQLRADWSSHTTSLTNEHTASMTSERERVLQAQAEVQRRNERERRELEQGHASKVEGLESRLSELDQANKELTDHKYRSEAAIRELKTKLRTTEEECSTLREEVQRLRRDNSTLDAHGHEQEKTMNQLRTRVAVLEQELQDKEQVISRTTELLGASNEQKRNHESSLEQKQRQITKLDTAFKSASQEVLKGNEIIQKLLAELRTVKSNLKLKNMVTVQQEKLLGEKEVSLEKQRHEMHSLNETLGQRQEEIRRLEEALESSKEKLEESRELLKTNENVISWLNKQMNEQVLGRRGGGMVLPDTLSTIRPSPPLSHLLPTSTTGALHPQKPQFSSTPAGGVGTAPRQILGSLTSQENIKQQVVFRGPVKKSGIPAPSSLSTHTFSLKTTPPAGTKWTDNPSKENLQAEPWLDPKYLPHEASASPKLPPSITPGVVRPPGRTKTSPSTATLPASALVSSYFPKS